MKWTPAQEDAVNSPVCDILVTAAAGAGKTQVLSGRIAKRVTGGADIGSMLVLTFTRAAAAEMRERVGQLLAAEVQNNPQDARLHEQLALLPSASITTIHSFCLNVLRSYFYLLDIDPGFRMADPAEAELLKLEAAEECLEQLYSSDNPAFLRLVDGLCSAGSDDKICDMILDIWNFAKSRPYPEDWLSGAKQAYEIDSLSDVPFTKVLLDAARDDLCDSRTKTKQAIALCEASGNGKYLEMFSGDLVLITGALESLDLSWDKARCALATPYPRKAVVRGEKDETVMLCDELRQSAKDRYSHAASLFSQSESDAVAAIRDMAEPVRTLCDAAVLFDEIYTEKKREKNVLDFSDLEQLTIRVLSEKNEDGTYSATDAAKELRARFEEIYVDEYQDTNLTQETIVRLISRDEEGAPNVFMVGDMKQSIYRFRQTSPKLVFGSKKSTYKNEGPYKKIALMQNFRSRKEVLDAINSAFYLLMSERSGEIEYTDEEALVSGSTFYKEVSDPCAHLCLVECEGNAATRLSAEAEAVAGKIKKLLSSGMTVYDKTLGGDRPLRASDIAILLRATKDKAQVFERALKAASIPVFSDVTQGFFESAPVRLFVSLLTVIDNPNSDVDLIAVLRSFLFSFSDPELADVAAGEGASFYEKLCACDDKKCVAVKTALAGWKKEALTTGAAAITRTLLSEAGFYEYAASRPGGAAQLKNLEQLCDLADRFEAAGMFGLFSFIRYLDNVRASSDMGEARTLSEGMDAVRIMSIHKSKGLEFPVVFVSTCASPFYLRDLSSPMMLDAELGIGIVAVDEEMRAAQRLLPLDAITEKTRFEAMSENLRLLYVAMTRAREQLYLTATIADANEAVTAWRNVSDYTAADVMSASSFLDWLGLCAVRDKKNFSLEIIAPNEEEGTAETVTRHLAPRTPKDEFTQKLSFIYPHTDMSKMPAKLSVTSLKQTPDDPDAGDLLGEYIKKPSLRTLSPASDGFTPAERGTLFHYVVENMDLSAPDADAALASVALSQAERAAIDKDKLSAFMQSPIFARMKNADKIYREADFTVRIPANMVDASLPEDDFVLLQGIIDCFFFEGDNIVLVDYKTDSDTRPEVILSRYRKQIELYAYALSQKFGCKIYEKYIYLFKNCSIIEL